MGHARSSSSSGEEDGDAEWKAAVDSIASADPFLARNFAVDASKPSSQNNDKLSGPIVEEDPDPKFRPQLPKHYQIKAQKLLDDIVERNLEIVSNSVTIQVSDREDDGGGIKLFRTAPRGITFDRTDEPQGPKRKPRILPGEEIDEKSKKFKRQLQSVVVDGLDVMGAAKAACQKSLARLEARDAAAKAAVKREEDRVAELKRIRGERWLPSIAKEMQLERQGRYNNV
ncbi:uncharacterized protein LOC115742144 isoform X2 [Rhodamnia argentea]|uniref:Uncharacterized protein LOC115742144 isoform X2 n=1 Tax=Rhodamnia argentea TaxID=178133 RepID=A0A8B8PBT5_9MYRT|nr:uncharacterized protein LOC115742144 isoform X2 [Rhodamnia argentea]